MSKITSRDSENLKFFHFLSGFFFPVFFVLRVLAASNMLFYDRSNLNALLIAVPLAYFSGAAAFTLKKFKPLSILWVILSDIFMTLNILIPISAAINANAPVTEFSTELGILVARIVFTVYSVIYLLRRKNLFAKDFEARKAMEASEAVSDEASDVPSEEPAPKAKKKVGKYILAPFLAIGGYSLSVDWSNNLLNELCYLFPPMQKLLAFPFPTAAPLETARTAFVMAIFTCLTFIACHALKNGGVFTLKELNISKDKKKLLPFIISTVIGIIFVLFIALFQMKVYGSALKVNKLFPRVWYAIISGFFYYLFVGITEEYIFRGFLFNFFAKKKKVILGVIVSTLTFDLMHFLTGAYDEFRAFVFLFFFGLFEAMLYLYTENIWWSAGVHFGYDWAVTHLIEMRFIANKNSFFFLTKLQKWTITTSVSVVYFLFTIVVFILYLRKRKKHEEAVG